MNKNNKITTIFKNLPPMKEYIHKLRSNDIYRRWVKLSLKLTSGGKLSLSQNKIEAPFIKIDLNDCKINILPVKEDQKGKEKMNYFTLKVYQAEMETEEK